MPSRRSALLVAGTALLAQLVAHVSAAEAQDASAPPVTWRAGSVVSTTTTAVQPLLAQRGEQSLLVWSDSDGREGGRVTLYAAVRRSRAEAWGGRTVLSSANASRVDLAAGPDGRAVVAWAQVVSAAEESVRARVLAPGSDVWGPETELARVPRAPGSFDDGVLDLRAVVLASGAPLVVWEDSRSVPGEPDQPYLLYHPVQASAWSPGGGWGPLEQVETNPGGEPLSLSATPAGTALLGYASGGNYFVFERSSAGAWSKRQDLLTQDYSGVFLPDRYLHLATNAAGTSVAVWSIVSFSSASSPDGNKLYVASRPAGGTWSTPRVLTVVDDANWRYNASLALGPLGGFLLAAQTPDAQGTASVTAHHLDEAGQVLRTSVPRGPSSPSHAFVVAGGPAGATLLFQGDGDSASTRTLSATRLLDTASGSWTAASVLSRRSSPVLNGSSQPYGGEPLPEAEQLADGSVVAAWAEPASIGTAGSAPFGVNDPDPHLVPSVAVRPAALRFGSTAEVVVTGTPGATVDLYTRKYLGEFVKIRDGLVLDDTGRATVTTRPDGNLRFQARDREATQPSSTGGTAGLVTVEKQVSLDVVRAGAGRLSFSGSANPLHPGATVDLYRDGRLLRARLPVSPSRTYATTVTVPAGVADYRVVSPGTGWNAASQSPVRSARP